MIDKVLRILLRIYNKKMLVIRIFSIPVYVQVYLVLILVAVLSLAGLWAQVPGILLAVFLSTLIHELGHAFFAVRAKREVKYIRLSLIHGKCVYFDDGYSIPPLSIAFGGVLFQAILLAVALLAKPFVPDVSSPYVNSNIFSFMFFIIYCNSVVLVFNLVPLWGLDGEKIWDGVACRINMRKINSKIRKLGK